MHVGCGTACEPIADGPLHLNWMTSSSVHRDVSPVSVFPSYGMILQEYSAQRWLDYGHRNLSRQFILSRSC